MSACNAAPVSGISGRGHTNGRDHQIIQPCRACRYVGRVVPEDHGYCQRCAAGIRMYRAIKLFREATR